MDPFAIIDGELEKIGDIATAGFFLSLRSRGTSPLYTANTYPQAWIDQYTEKAYVLRDPITIWAMTVGGRVRWSSAMLPDPFRIFRRAAEHGLRYGASVTHGALGSLTICSFARSDRELTDAEIAAVRDIIVALHDRFQLPKSLDDTERAILQAVARAQGISRVAADLGMADDVVKKRIRQICAALLARTTDEAVQRARDYKLL